METKTTTKTYKLLLQTAKKLFWKDGIYAVSVEEICKVADVSKMTFYRYFKNKDEIAEAVIDTLIDKGIKKYRSIMQSDVHFEIKAKELIRYKYKEIKGISAVFIDDVYGRERHSALSEKMQTNRIAMQQEMLQDFKKAQDKGEIDRALNLDFILFMLNDLNGKFFNKELRALFKNEEAFIKQLNQFFFYGIAIQKA